MSKHTFAALVLAAGSGSRLGAELPKAWLEIDGVPIWTWSARRLARVAGHVGTVVAVDQGSFETRVPAWRDSLEDEGVRQVVVGGATRQESCARAFEAICAWEGELPELIAVHDAARPFFDRDSVQRALEGAHSCGGAIVGSRARDTLKRVGEDGQVEATVDRSRIFHAATPQVFRRESFERMLAWAAENDVRGTDEAGLAEACGVRVCAIDAPSTNVKLTFPEDLMLIPSLRPLLEDGARAETSGGAER